MSTDAYRVAAKIIKPKDERDLEEDNLKGPEAKWDPHVEKAQRRDAIANHRCLRTDINNMAARRDILILRILGMSHDPALFNVHALGMAVEADTLSKAINLLSDGTYKHTPMAESSLEDSN